MSRENSTNDRHEITIQGIPASPGVVAAPALRYGDILDEVVTRRIEPDEIEDELSRFHEAARLVKEELERDAERISDQLGKSEADIFLVHTMILEDRKLVEAIEERIREDRMNADAAVATEIRRVSDVLMGSDDSYLRDRSYDITDIGKRVIERILGVYAHCPLTQPMIIVAGELRASDTVSMDRGRVLGFVTELGGRQAHAAILSRSLGVPAVVGAHGAVGRVRSGDMVIVDGNTGLVIINPTEETLGRYSRKQEHEAEEWADLSPYRELEPVTLDGTAIAVMANIASSSEAADARRLGAEGIGLFRTEMAFMAAGLYLSEDEQYDIYREAVEAMQARPVTIRTLDVGGDKFVGPENPLREHNPHLGYRSIRVSLDRPDVFVRQMRAMLRAAAHGRVRVLWPMISGVRELRDAKGRLAEAAESLDRDGIERGEVESGVMIEIPSAVMVSDRLAKESDFLSIGTNDLIQYALAVDRGNTYVDHLYQPHDPSVLALIARTAESAAAAGKPVAVCGEMAGVAEYVPLLIGLGIRELSVALSRTLIVRKAVRETDTSEARRLAERALQAATPEDVAELIGLAVHVRPDGGAVS